MIKATLKLVFFKLIFLFTIIATQVKAQISLIPDGGFEDTTTGWNDLIYGSDGDLKDWFQIQPYLPINKWFIFSYLSLGNNVLPVNPYIISHSKYGINTVNMVAYIDSNYEPKDLCYLVQSVTRSKLSSKLIAGKEYCATIWATASEQTCYLFTNGLGMYFDNGQLDTIYTKHKDSSGRYTFVKPQLQCPFLINDTANWMKIQGSFIANGTESYVTLGNFLHDSVMLKAIEMTCGGLVTFHGQNILIDNASLIPLDITNWLQATYYPPNADSVWVGLDKLDYADGKWYDVNMNYITTGPGFWYKGTIEGGKQFIHEIDVCGSPRFDTTTLIEAPLSIATTGSKNVVVYPNPASTQVTISNIQQAATFKLVNALGNTVLSQPLRPAASQTIQLPALANGVYSYTINQAEQVYWGKLLIVKE
jgi:hypothetical protein